MSRLRTPAILALALLVGSTALAPSASAASKRFTTLFEEHVDGKKQPTSAAETKLIGVLLNAGVTFIDEAQSRKIRSVTDAGQLMAGKISPVITTLDADVIVAGICRVSQIKSSLLGEGTFRYDASIQAKVIAVDTGQVLGAHQVRGEALDFVASQAAEKAASKAAEALAKEVLKARAAAASRIELTVTGVPNITAGEKVLQAVKRVSGVKSAEMMRAGNAVSKIEIKTSGKSARDIALALDGAKGLGVSVIGYSDSAIKATYAPEAAMNVPVLITPLAMKGKSKKDAWQGKALAGILGTALSNLQYVELPRGTDTVSLGKPKSWGGKLKKLGVDPAGSLVLAGTFQPSGENVSVAVRLIIGANGQTIAAATKSCPRADLSGCVGQLGSQMADGLMKNMLAKRHLFKGKVDLKPPARMVAGADSAKPLEFGELSLENLFPSRLSAYANSPLGTLGVENKGDGKLTNVVVTTHLPGLMASPLDVKLPDIAKGEQRGIPLKVVLDRQKLVRHDENMPAVLSVVVRYNDGEFRMEEKRSKALVVYDRNTLSWKEPASVGAFVTPRTSTVQALAKSYAASLTDKTKSNPLSVATALFSGLSLHGIRYQKDPVNPYGADALDYVQYPEQTLSTKAGDCDDLAVLYASLGEALGLRMLFITTPSHVFVAVHTGVPGQNAATLAVDPTRVLTHDGLAWIPLETTLIGKPVSAAWAAAAKELARWKSDPSQVQIIDIRKAWGDFPPSSLVAQAPSLPAHDAAKLQQAVESELKVLAAARDKELTAELAKVEKALKKKPKDGMLLLRKGFLLMLADKTEDALTAFKGAVADRKAARSAHNNIANVLMVRGQLPEARKAYTKAIGKKADDARLLVNAALAAHASGDEDGFADYVFQVLELGAEDLVVSLSKAGVSVEAGTRGADAGGLAARDLTAAIRKVYEKKKRTMPKALEQTKTRASDAAAVQQPLETYLFWL